MKSARNLMGVTDEHINACTIPYNGEVEVCDDASIANRPQIRVEFHFVRRMNTYGTEQVRQDRLGRSMLGYAVPYQALTAC